MQAETAALVSCPMCGLRQTVGPVPAHHRAHCARCDTVLHRPAGVGRSQHAFCFALGALVLLAPAYHWPVLEITTLGQSHHYTVLSGVVAVWQGAMWPLAVPIALASVVFPASLILLILFLAGASWRGTDRAALRPWLRLCEGLGAWSIVDVYLLAIFVTVVKLAQLTDAAPTIGSAFFFAMVICLTLALRALDPAAVRRTGSPPDAGSTSRTFALALAALILFIPANIYPTLSVTAKGSTESATVLDGVLDLWHAGMWPLAIIVVCASLLIPFFKIIGLMLLTLTIAHTDHRRGRTRLYRFIAQIGRWSMLDVYVISLIVAVMHFGALAGARAEIGSIAFVAVVIVTLAAARSFDPRLLWPQTPPASGPGEPHDRA